MRKIAVIGHLDWQSNHMIGAVVKARNILEELQTESMEYVGSLDIYEWRKHKAKVFAGIISTFMSYRNIILVCSNTNNLLMKLFSLLKKVFQNCIHYCVVGGDMADNLAQTPEIIPALKCIDYFYVETKDCVAGLKNLGFKNVVLLKNFKRIEAVSKDELSRDYQPPYKFCTFSRVVKQKGISDAISAIEEINNVAGKTVCVLDIFGPIETDYKDEFETILQRSMACRYKGIVESSESVNILKYYYCLLFPTLFQTEGIPGTIVDAYAAGIPVIASDWFRCRQIVDDYKTGLIYEFGSKKDLIAKINEVIDESFDIYQMKINCVEKFAEYQSDVAIKPLIERVKD